MGGTSCRTTNCAKALPLKISTATEAMRNEADLRMRLPFMGG